MWPNFSIPEGWERHGWNERLEPVLIVQPDGQQIEATAHISVTHLHVIGEDVPMDLLWRISVWFMDWAEGDIPIGSRILVAREIKDAIIPERSP